MQKCKYVFFSMVVMVFISSFTIPVKEKINWISFDELEKLYKTNPKPILIDVYTNWCGWCKVMDKQTYDNEKVAHYINEKYYAVKFNAESTDSISFAGKIYKYNAAHKANELATYFLYERMVFPSTVFLSSPDAQPAPLSGFLKPADIEIPLKYFGDGAYKSQNYPEFSNALKKEW